MTRTRVKTLQQPLVNEVIIYKNVYEIVIPYLKPLSPIPIIPLQYKKSHIKGSNKRKQGVKHYLESLKNARFS
jgi:hypothetical protein